MTRKTKIWLIALALLSIYLIAAWFAGVPFGLRGRDPWILRGALWLAGLVVAGVCIWLLTRQKVAAADRGAAASRVEDIDATLAAARRQLASARLTAGSAIGKFPLVLLVGPEGSAKTTMVVRSGLEPELLAGEVFRGEAVAPTRAVNVWYSSDTIFVEAGGKVLAESAAWARLLRHIRPKRLAAVLTGRAHAPRVAVVCFSCEELVKPSNSEVVLAAARSLRERLTEASRQLGVRLPVYVLFTKADRIAYFPDYVHNLSNEEAREVLGATLASDTDSVGAYADRQSKRLNGVLQHLFLSLATKRLQLLPRENAPERKPGAYEFPREFRKLSPLIVQFLVDLCKPSQLHLSPFLRGFYFTAVRPVIVREIAPAIAPQAASAQASIALNATGVFDQAQVRGVASGYAPPVPTSRKVPQWLFVERVFRDVMLGDQAAMDVTRRGTGVGLMRRALLAVVSVLALLFATAITASYLGNRNLKDRVTDAVRGVAAARGRGLDGLALPTVDALRPLDSLRDRLVLLGDYERNQPPWWLRFGLYSGSELYPPARSVYFNELKRLMLGAARDSLLSSLRTLPNSSRPEDYNQVYESLKAYLITTTNPDKSSPQFLTPVLLKRWLGSRQLEPERARLARQQFDFYGEELRLANPYSDAADVSAVEGARGFLRKFPVTDRVYQAITSEISQRQRSIQFNRDVPNSAAVVVNSYEVPGAFTKRGWEEVSGRFARPERFFQAEPWVLEGSSNVPVERTALVEGLRSRYVADYTRHWRAYLTSASVAGYANVADAANKLRVLSENQSPLLAMLSLASQNTAVDAQGIVLAFQPVQAVTPPNSGGRLIGKSNESYVAALRNLQIALNQVASAPAGMADAAVVQALTSVSNAKAQAGQITQGFSGDTAVGGAVQRLLEAPIASLDALLRNFGSSQINAKGGSFCALYQPLMAKYPFNPSAVKEASLDEMAAVFQPQTGALWTLYNEGASKLLERRGTTFVPKATESASLSPGFVRFFNRAAGFSDALYREGAIPRLSFTLKARFATAISAAMITIGSQTATFTQDAQDAKPFVWSGAPGDSAQLSVRIGSSDVTLLSFKGPWAAFKLFHAAERWRTSGNTLIGEWAFGTGGQQATVSGESSAVTFELNLGGAPPVVRRDYFDGYRRCMAAIAR